MAQKKASKKSKAKAKRKSHPKPKSEFSPAVEDVEAHKGVDEVELTDQVEHAYQYEGTDQDGQDKILKPVEQDCQIELPKIVEPVNFVPSPELIKMIEKFDSIINEIPSTLQTYDTLIDAPLSDDPLTTRLQQTLKLQAKQKEHYMETYKLLKEQEQQMGNRELQIQVLNTEIQAEGGKERMLSYFMGETMTLYDTSLKKIGKALEERNTLRRTFTKEYTKELKRSGDYTGVSTRELVRRGKANQGKAAGGLYPFLLNSLKQQLLYFQDSSKRQAPIKTFSELNDNLDSMEHRIKQVVGINLRSREYRSLIPSHQVRIEQSETILKYALNYLHRAVTWFAPGGVEYTAKGIKKLPENYHDDGTVYWKVSALNVLINALVSTLKSRAMEVNVINFHACPLIDNYRTMGLLPHLKTVSSNAHWDKPTVIVRMKNPVSFTDVEHTKEYLDQIKFRINSAYATQDAITEAQLTRTGNLRLVLGDRYWLKMSQGFLNWIQNSNDIAFEHSGSDNKANGAGVQTNAKSNDIIKEYFST